MGNSPRAFDITLVATLTAALIYAGGWSYAYHWYDYFELGLIGLGIPYEYHFMYGFWVVKTYWWLILPIALLLTAVLAFWGRLGPILIPATPIWIPLAFLLFYFLGGLSAEANYREHRKLGFQGYSWTRVWIKADSDTLPAKLQKVHRDLAEGKYRLLLETDKSLYLIRPDKNSDRDGGEIPTLQIPLSRVHALRRISTNPGKS